MNEESDTDKITILLDKVSRGGSLENGEIGYLDAPGIDGKNYRLTFSPHLIPALIDALYKVQGSINKERERTGHGLIYQRTIVKKIAKYGFTLDPGEKVAVIRIQFVDHTHQDVPIAQNQIDDMIRFLRQAKQIFQEGQ